MAEPSTSQQLPQFFKINNQNHVIRIYFVRLDDKGLTETIEELNFDYINDVKIFSNISEIVPTIRITVSDPDDNYYIKWPIDGRTLIAFELLNTDDDITIRSEFILNKVEVLQQDAKFAAYQLDGIHPFKIRLNAPLIYSTGDNDLPFTEIIEDIFKEENISIFEKTDDLIHTDNTGKFISLTKNTLYDNLDILLNSSSSPNTGFYFLMFNALTEQKLKLMSMSQLYTSLEEDFKLPVENIAMDVSIHNMPKNRERIPFVLVYENYILPSDYLNIIRNKKLHSFDNKTRKWNTDEYTFENHYGRFNNSLQLTSTPFMEDMSDYFKGDDYKGDEEYEYRKPGNTRILGSVYKNVFNNFNSVYLEVYGQLNRNVGQLFGIVSEDNQNPSITNYRSNILTGQWIVTDIVHSFSKNTFKQYMHLCKFDCIKEF